MRTAIYFFLSIISYSGLSQNNTDNTYVDNQGNTHLKGAFLLERLEQDTLFKDWFKSSYESFESDDLNPLWKDNLKDVQVEIYLGTWCGDSKNWVPKFVKYWDDLKLNRNQLNFSALYNGEDKYKQGPNGEEKNKGIHRVPTFIFKRDGKEVARMVETPLNNLETDIAQIALGYPSEPNYRAATYLTKLLKDQPIDTIYKEFRAHIYEAYELTSGMSELNTLGYVYLRSGRIDEALVVFQINTYLFRYNPNVYDSYGEALTQAGNTKEAIVQYKKVLDITPDNENALEQLALLKE